MLLSLVRRAAVAFFFVVTLVSPVFGQRGEGRAYSGPGTGNPDEHLVPWMFLSKGGDLVKAPLVLYWLPASTDEMKRSSLLTSHALLEASARCVQFEIVL